MRKPKKIRFFAAFAGVMAVMLATFALLLTYTGAKMERVIEENLTQQTNRYASQQADVFYNIYKVSRSMLATCIYDQEISAILKSPQENDVKAIRAMQEKLRYFDSYHLSGLPYRITVYDLKGNTYSTWTRNGDMWEDIFALPQTQSALEKNTSFFTLRHKMWYDNDEYSDHRVQVFSFANLIQDQYSAKPIGLLLLSIDEAALLNSLESEQHQIALLSGKTGTYFYGSVPEALCAYVLEHPNEYKEGELSRIDWEGKRYLVTHADMGSLGVHMVQLLPYETAYADFIALRRTNTAFLISSVLLMALISTLLLFGLTRPLKRLFEQVRTIDLTGGAVSHIVVGGYRECEEMAHAVNEMCDRTAEMVELIKKEQQGKSELRYRYLVSQLNPHFLLNSLNNIKWIAYMSKAHKVAEMISALGFLLETSLGKKGSSVTIRYELDYVRRYMFLQELHFGDNLTYECHVEEELLDLPFEKFTLQLLIDNAIKHGYEKGKKLHIIIHFARQDNKLTLTVTDNGKGMTPERLQAVQDWLSSPQEKEEKGHLGLTNISRRLYYLYGGDAYLQIDSTLGIGTVVTAVFPYDRMHGEISDV